MSSTDTSLSQHGSSFLAEYNVLLNNCIVPKAAIMIHLAHQKLSHEERLSFAKSHLFVV